MHGSNLNGSNLNPSVDFSDPSTIVGLISKLRTSTPILNRIPKGARIAVADELSNILISCINDNSLVKWLRLLIFPYCVLRVPEKSLKKTQSLSSAVKINLEFWKRNKDLSSQSLFNIYLSKSKPTKINKKKPGINNIYKKIESKLSNGDLRGAIRLLCSQDSLAPNDDTTFLKLQEKPNIIDGLSSCSSVTSNEVYNAIMSFYPGSAGGLDSLKPQHLKDLISDKLGLSSSNLLSSLAKIIDLMFLGLIPLEISQILYGASLCALSKKDGGIRPIAVGCTLRRLAAKIVCTRISEQMGNFLNPLQLGFGTKYGAEAGAHSARNYLSYSHSSVKAF
jgi:hypothetical protein